MIKIYTRPGFTLLEAIVYMGLLTLLLSAALLSSYYLTMGQSSAHSNNATQEEGAFAVRKIEWALNDVTTATTPSSVSPYTSTLDVVSNNGTRIRMRRNVASSSIEMSENSTTNYYPLTTANVKVTTLSFHYLPSSSGSSDGLEASTTINGEEFDVIRYFK